MILYLPYGTDAPLYHRPVVTIVMIVINIVVFAMFTREQIEPYMLATGNGLHPIQWLTVNFLHADIFHIIGNMVFLWVFGPVIEGKIGFFKMSALYLGICILFGATLQMLMLGQTPGFSLGASGVIFGLAAMSFIWAPENKVHGVLIFWFIRYGFVKDTETEISLIVGFFAVLQVAWSCFFGSGLLGELGHINGAVLGLVIAIVMLKCNLVDCEYGDIFSVWSGKKDQAAAAADKPDAAKRRAERQQQREKRQNLLTEEIKSAIQNQAPLPAFIIAQRKEREFTDWTLPQDLHLTLIQQLLGGKHWEEAVTSMRQYLERHQEQSVFVRLMLSQALLTQRKPKAVLKVLDEISPEGLEQGQRTAISKIRQKAEAMYPKNLEEGVYELEE